MLPDQMKKMIANPAASRDTGCASRRGNGVPSISPTRNCGAIGITAETDGEATCSKHATGAVTIDSKAATTGSCEGRDVLSLNVASSRDGPWKRSEKVQTHTAISITSRRGFLSWAVQLRHPTKPIVCRRRSAARVISNISTASFLVLRQSQACEGTLH